MDLSAACQQGNLVRVRELLEEQSVQETDSAGACLSLLNSPDAQGILPLHWAALNGHTSVARYLLDRGAHIGAVSGDQAAPALHWALCKGHAQTTALLLDYGADWRQTDKTGYAAPHIAAQNGQSMLLLYLIETADVDVDACDGFGRTALLWAAYKGHSETVETLIGLGAAIDLADHSNRTPLLWAVIKGNASAAAKLLKAGARLDLADVDGKRAADWAREKEIVWFSALEAITLQVRSKSPVAKTKAGASLLLSSSTAEFVAAKALPALLPFAMSVPFAVCERGWIACLLAGSLVSAIYKLAGSLLSRPLPDSSFLSVFNYSMTLTVTAVYYLWVVPAATLSPSLAVFVASSALMLFKLAQLQSRDPGAISKTASPEERRHHLVSLAGANRLDRRHYCSTCRQPKPLRSKHCKTCDRCVGRFDHHCPWIGGCVGCGNHRAFLCYVIGSAATACSATVLGYRHLQRAPEAFAACQILQRTFLCRMASFAPLIFWFTAFLAFAGFWVLVLLVTQVYQISRNLTTNEFSNYARLEYFHPEGSMDSAGTATAAAAAAGTASFANPFDRGVLGNWIEFWRGERESEWLWRRELGDEDVRRVLVRRSRQKKRSLLPSDQSQRIHSSAASVSASTPFLGQIGLSASPALKAKACRQDCCKDAIQLQDLSKPNNDAKRALLRTEDPLDMV